MQAYLQSNAHQEQLITKNTQREELNRLMENNVGWKEIEDFSFA